MLSLLLWMMLVKANVKQWKKLVIIPITLWWAIALYYIPLNFMGYPSSKEMPNNAIIYSWKATEPTNERKGNIYFWIIDPNKAKHLPADPRKAFAILYSTEPHSYKLPYYRELHKKLIEKDRESKESLGNILVWKNLKKGKEGKRYSAAESDRAKWSNLEIINPVTLLPPKE